MRAAYDASFDAIAATIVISLAPIFLVYLLPVGVRGHENLLNVFLSFAVGGLLGDVFLHLMPHALLEVPASHIESHTHHGHSEHSHDHSHDHSHSSHDEHDHDHAASNFVGLWVLAGILTFYLVEKFARAQNRGHSHSHSDAFHKKNDDLISSRTRSSDMNGEAGERTKGGYDEDGIKVAGWLNLIADIMHNFTDGLALGAAFLISRAGGIITFLAVLIHEVPHEIGDFAILIQSGFSRRKAIGAQFVTALGALMGTIVSLTFGGMSPGSSAWILPFTAGGFIYIACVSVIPELLESQSSISQSIIEVFAMMFGVCLMLAVGVLEEFI